MASRNLEWRGAGGLFVYYPSQFASDYDPNNTSVWEGYAGSTLFDFAAPLMVDTTAFARWAALVAPVEANPAATLPPTGAEPAAMGIAGAALLLFGTLALARTRRRGNATDTD